MKSYPRLAQIIFNEPWAIIPQVLESISAQFLAHTGIVPRADCDDPVGPGYVAWNGATVYQHPQIEENGGLALVRVHGILGRHLDSLEMQCGGYDVALLEQQMENITEDEDVKAVVIDFRSPGGSVAGIETAAKAIMDCRASGKKIYAYTSDKCASAAYWLACACDELHAESSAVVGSISTIVAGVDNSEEWKMDGKIRKVFATGKFKATGMCGKAWTQDEEDNLWSIVRSIDADFKGFVSARRGLSDDLMQGQWWYASHAPEGLVDSTDFRNLNQLLEAVYATF